MHKPISLFNNRTRPIFKIGGILLLLIGIGIAREVWFSFFSGTLYGKCLIEHDDTPALPIENIEISWDAGTKIRRSTPVFTNTKGEYIFERKVPVGYNIVVTATFENDHHITKYVGEIEGVKWFLGIPWLRLPLSSGIPKRVDFTIPTDVSLSTGTDEPDKHAK